MGSGVKEQLWALLEFMEEGEDDGSERIFCTTDVHKAFDQVYRNGTIYLLYGMGVRGKMLHMLDQWIGRNYDVQKWRGHAGNRVELAANGLRQILTLNFPGATAFAMIKSGFVPGGPCSVRASTLLLQSCGTIHSGGAFSKPPKYGISLQLFSSHLAKTGKHSLCLTLSIPSILGHLCVICFRFAY